MSPRLRLPRLSIRHTVLAAIVVGVVLPAAVVVGLDSVFTRRAQLPMVERNRAALMVLASAVVTEPAWTLSAPGLEAAVQRLLEEPSVCSVALLDLQPTVPPLERRRADCAAPVTERETTVLHELQPVARLRVGFDDSEIDRALAERRGITVRLVAAQVALGVLVLAGVLSLRLLRPIARLRHQAESIVARAPMPEHAWSHDDELGQLGQHLNTVHTRIGGLIGELETKNAELHRLAMHDALTGLPNRALLRELFDAAAATAQRRGESVALMFIDLDGFKTVNDTWGHAAGDELLLAVARALRESVRAGDVVSRLGGDEFLLLLPGIGTPELVHAAAGRVRRALQHPFALPRAAEKVRVRASAGVAIHPRDGADFDELMRAADVAMYRSKATGRSRVSLYRPEFDTGFRERAALERELREAIERCEFVVHYQPSVDARDGRPRGCEALVRWQHPRRGLLGPAEFIEAAEHTGLVGAIGRLVLDDACAQLAAWRAEGAWPGLKMAVNVSALQLREPDFPAVVAATMQRHGVRPGELELELTESTLLADGDGALRALVALRDAGAELALDDFGTGYSSLSMLKRVRPDKLKIDRGFVRGLPGDADDRALVQAILAMARALGIAVVAEGVETGEQRDWLVTEGCVLQQGWLWGRPAAAGALRRLQPGQVTDAVATSSANSAADTRPLTA